MSNHSLSVDVIFISIIILILLYGVIVLQPDEYTGNYDRTIESSAEARVIHEQNISNPVVQPLDLVTLFTSPNTTILRKTDFIEPHIDVEIPEVIYIGKIEIDSLSTMYLFKNNQTGDIMKISQDVDYDGISLVKIENTPMGIQFTLRFSGATFNVLDR